MNKKITRLQIFYVVSLLASFVLTGLAEGDVLPSEYVGNEPEKLYWINLYSIVTGFGGMFVTLRWFYFRSIRKAVCQPDETAGASAFLRWNWIRLVLLAVLLLSNAVLYEASSYTATPKYCMLILYVAYVFCWPSLAAFSSLRAK